MKKLIACVLLLVTVSIGLSLVIESSKPVLRFNPDGKFKIVQFTDVHFQVNSYRSDSALALMKKVLRKEKPDLVLLTGDIVCSKDTRNAWLALSRVIIEAKTPWAVTLGNHDAQYDLSKAQIMEVIVGLPYNLTEIGPTDVNGCGNYIIQMRSSKDEKPAALLYCFDSQMGFHPKTDLGSYQWMDYTQINWYREQSRWFTRQNRNQPLPSLAFFHIPLPEYKEVVGKSTTVGLQQETICSPDLNSGMYTAMLEGKDVMGMFVGHDHDNNYIGCLRDICLAYGNVTGRQCYGKIGRGARVIELFEGERRFNTWILKLYECNREKDIWRPVDEDQHRFFVTYPDSFVDK